MNRNKLHKALVVVQTHINAQTEALGLAYGMMKSKFESVKTSSIYLAYSDPTKRHTPTGQLIFAATVLATETAEEMQEILNEFVEQNPRAIEITVLAYDDETRLAPKLTLPHPDLHLKPQWLIPSAEIWGEFEHPILAKPLHEIAGSTDWGAWGQFYAQGEKLVEFSSKQSK
jgi:7,8-dihydro-6-hydroxymethylpterin-pyrophosphokinase